MIVLPQFRTHISNDKMTFFTMRKIIIWSERKLIDNSESAHVSYILEEQ